MKTIESLLSREAVEQAARDLDCDVAAVRAVAEVESNGSGFLSDGRPKILFEGHQFSKRTGGVFDAKYPTISYPTWTRVHYLGGAREYERLATARALNEVAALESTSWGAFQIMGFNALAAGFADVFAFVKSMQEDGADAQLRAFVAFVQSKGLDAPLRRHDWRTFARGYNGIGYSVNRYDTKLADAHVRHGARA